jgi:hypothetical protein
MKKKKTLDGFQGMDCCQKLKHRLLIYRYKNMLNKNYERTEVLA